MRIFLVVDADKLPDVHRRLADLAVASDPDKHFFEFDDPAKADVFLFLRHGMEEREALNINNHELIKKYPGKCFLWDDGDHPLAMLPGLYSSLPSNQFDPKFHRTTFYLSRSNNLIGELKAEYADKTPLYLASFQGNMTSNVRMKLMRLKLTTDRIILKTASQLWSAFMFGTGFNSREAAVEAYARLMHESKFVLCPKGNGISSYRLFETLEAGKVPVIIADKFVPLKVPTTGEYALYLKEADINTLESFLVANEPEFERLAQNAADVFSANFADNRKVHYIGEMLEDILKTSTINSLAHLKSYQQKVLLLKKIQVLESKLKITISKMLKKLRS